MKMRWAMFQKYAESMAGVVAVFGSAIAFCPVWSGEWSQSKLVVWLSVTATMIAIVGLYALSKQLYRNGHQIRSMLVLALVLPVLNNGTRIVAGHGFSASSFSFDGILQRFFGGYYGFSCFALVIAVPLYRSMRGMPSSAFPLVEQEGP